VSGDPQHGRVEQIGAHHARPEEVAEGAVGEDDIPTVNEFRSDQSIECVHPRAVGARTERNIVTRKQGQREVGKEDDSTRAVGQRSGAGGEQTVLERTRPRPTRCAWGRILYSEVGVDGPQSHGQAFPVDLSAQRRTRARETGLAAAFRGT
jgi:hypothetical protein